MVLQHVVFSVPTCCFDTAATASTGTDTATATAYWHAAGTGTAIY
jgi:hypothetical protein